MKTSYAATLALALAAVSAGSAFAADPAAPLTRADVRAEMVEAKRTGNMPADAKLIEAFGGTPGQKMNELFPSRYAGKTTAAAAEPVRAEMVKTSSTGLTREQVRAELVEAQRTGDVVASDDLIYAFGGTPGQKMNELFPGRYPAKAAK